MSPEILAAQARQAIKRFNSYNEGVCCLIVKNGYVSGVPARCVSSSHPWALRIERSEFRGGLTTARWHAIARELFILYTQEQQCQNRPKP